MKFDTNKSVNIIGKGTVVQGKVVSEGSLHIDGKIIGDIVTNENVEIGLIGTVSGNIQAKSVKIAGKVEGKIDSNDSLTFSSKAIVRGDIKAAKLIIEEGAQFNGNCAMVNGQTAKPKE